MTVATLHGRVRGGRLEVDERVDLPDGTEVELTVLVDTRDGLDDRQRADLYRDLRTSLREAERGEDVPMEQVLDELDDGE